MFFFLVQKKQLTCACAVAGVGTLCIVGKSFFGKQRTIHIFLKKIFLESRSGLFFFFKKISSNEPVERGPFFLLEKVFFGKLQVMCFFLIDHIVPTRW